jgi:hypothetical protein
LVVEIFKEWSKVLKFQDGQDVVVIINRDLHKPHQLSGNCTGAFQTARKIFKLKQHRNIEVTANNHMVISH